MWSWQIGPAEWNLGDKSGSVLIRTGTGQQPAPSWPVDTDDLTAAVSTVPPIQVHTKKAMEGIMAGEGCAPTGRTWALRTAGREESRREHQFYRFVWADLSVRVLR